MTTKNVQCPVEAAEAFGVYANAFRILSGGGGDLFLDFCVYSEQDDKAKVVSRVRVGPDFLKVMMDRINEDQVKTIDLSKVLFVMPGPLVEN
jgi:hypothetical protein|tara:strand:+ start:21 stop:296 length:276 start_codon:yes stop_codon:yes gene_type:complete